MKPVEYLTGARFKRMELFKGCTLSCWRAFSVATFLRLQDSSFSDVWMLVSSSATSAFDFSSKSFVQEITEYQINDFTKLILLLNTYLTSELILKIIYILEEDASCVSSYFPWWIESACIQALHWRLSSLLDVRLLLSFIAVRIELERW